jgi:hypothetical protein
MDPNFPLVEQSKTRNEHGSGTQIVADVQNTTFLAPLLFMAGKISH